MKRALVLSLIFAVGLSIAAFGAGAFSGSITVDAQFSVEKTEPQYVYMDWFETVLEVDYTVCNWTFGAWALFSKTEFANLYFEAEGVLGAFSGYAWLDFDPMTPAFDTFYAEATVSIAGVDLYAAMMLATWYVDYATYTPTKFAGDAVGFGVSIGGSGVAGDCKFGAYAFFNFDDTFDLLSDYGFSVGWATMRSWFLYAYDCDGLFVGDYWQKPYYFFGLTDSCALTFSSLHVIAEFPFTCLTVLADIKFDCLVGFKSVAFELNDLDIGIPWLLLDDFNIIFTTTSKTIDFDINLILGDAVCITPYLSIVQSDSNVIHGIEFNAITIDYTFNGVAFSAGTIVDNTWRRWLGDSVRTWGFAPDGSITYIECEKVNAAYDEFFAVVIDGDSCCGGAFSVGLYNWFDIGAATGIFDWQETTLYINLDVGTQTELRFGGSLGTTGVNYVTAGITFSW
jgi:hypothetical protein